LRLVADAGEIDVAFEAEHEILGRMPVEAAGHAAGEARGLAEQLLGPVGEGAPAIAGVEAQIEAGPGEDGHGRRVIIDAGRAAPGQVGRRGCASSGEAGQGEDGQGDARQKGLSHRLTPQRNANDRCFS